MAVLASLLSLLIVVAICAIGVRWLAGRVHGRGALDRELEQLMQSDRCLDCDGTGASRSRGELRPCPACEGTGVSTASF